MIMVNQIEDIDPPKWTKHKMLIFWGLRNEIELSSTIKRYSIKEYEKCLKTIDDELNVSSVSSVYIIKLVYRNSVYKLPNFLIQNHDDILACRDKLKNLNDNQFIEVWYCRNIIQKEMIYGRVLISLDGLFPRIGTRKMEVVWGNSARLIEQYPNLNCAFASVETDGWGRNFQIIDIILADKSKGQIQEMLVELLRLLSHYQRRIINFGKYIYNCGCSMLCIEFSYSDNGVFTIIDWDSDNDMMAVKKFSQESYIFSGRD